MDFRGNEGSQGNHHRVRLPYPGIQTQPTINVGVPGEANPHINEEQQLLIPIANVGRIMQRILPVDFYISDESVEAVQNCVSEFIMFITSEARDVCIDNHRSILGADDLITAMNNLGYDNYVHALQIYLRRYRAHESVRLGLPPRPSPAFLGHHPGFFPAPRPISHQSAAGPFLAARPNIPPARTIPPGFFPTSGAAGPSASAAPRYPPGFLSPARIIPPKIELSGAATSGPRHPPGFFAAPRPATRPKIELSSASTSGPRYPPPGFSAVPKIEPSDDAGPSQPKFTPFIQAKKE